jgi:hypothetical protein
VLALQTNGTTALSISAAQVVSFTNSPTYTAGTANGVAYLNASKVLTTGSALTFDGTTLGVGANIALGSTVRYIYQTGAANLQLQVDTGQFVWAANNGSTEQMRLTSTGLGIGTSSPSFKLDVTGTMRSSASGAWNSSFTSTTGGLVYCDNTTGGGAILNIRRGRDVGTGSVDSVGLDALNTAGNTVVPMILRGTPLYITDGTGTTTFSGGNLGIGVTPSASAYKTVELTGIAITGINATDGRIYGNAYESSGGAVYKTSSFATLYKFNAGSHIWYNAPSGTAGNAITFTQAMTLDASGNLLVGTTSTLPASSNVVGFAVNNSGYISLTGYGTSAIDCNRTNDGIIQAFRQGGALVGSVSVTTLLTSYNTTSDYRLKEFVAPVTNSGERIDALNPVEFDWKSDGSRARGFFAHEFQQVYASSVTGTKDAVDEDGKPVYQAMQASTSEVIADLVAEIKSLRVRLNALENK